MVPMGNHPKDENKYRRGRELIVVIKTKVPPLPCDRHLTHDRWPDQAPHGHDCREDEQGTQADLWAAHFSSDHSSGGGAEDLSGSIFSIRSSCCFACSSEILYIPWPLMINGSGSTRHRSSHLGHRTNVDGETQTGFRDDAG